MRRISTLPSGFTPLRFLILLCLILGTFSIQAQVVWDGSESTDWSNGDNWVGGTVPTATQDAQIPDLGLAANYPEVSTAQTVRSLELLENASLSIATTGHLIVDGDDNVTTGIKSTGAFSGAIRINVMGTLEITNLAKNQDVIYGILAEEPFPCPIQVSGLLRVHDLAQEFAGNIYALYLYNESPLTITEMGEVLIEDITVSDMDDNHNDDYELIGIYNETENPILVEGKLTMQNWTGNFDAYGIYQDDINNGISISATGYFQFINIEIDQDYLYGVYQNDNDSPISVAKGGKIEMINLDNLSEDGEIYGIERDDDEEDFINNGEVLFDDWDAGNYIAGIEIYGESDLINHGLIKITNMVAQGDDIYGIYLGDDYTSLYNEEGGRIELSNWKSGEDIYSIYIYYLGEIDNAGEITMEDFNALEGIFGLYLEYENFVTIDPDAVLTMKNFLIEEDDGEIYGLYIEDYDDEEPPTIDIYGDFIMEDFEADGDDCYIYGMYFDDTNTELTIHNRGLLSMNNFEAVTTGSNIYGFYLEDEEQYFTIEKGGLVSMTNFAAAEELHGIYHYYYSYFDIFGTLFMDEFSSNYEVIGIYDSDGYMMVDIGNEGLISMNNFTVTGVNGDEINGWYVYEELDLENKGRIFMTNFSSSNDVYGFYSDDMDDVNNEETGLIQISNLQTTNTADNDISVYAWYFEDGELENRGKVEIENINGGASDTYGMYNYGGEITNQESGVINISGITTTTGTAYGMYDESSGDDHENEGTIKIYDIQGNTAYALFHDAGTFTNKSCARFLTDGRIWDPEDDNDHDFTNEDGGLIIEEGNVASKIFENEGTVYNLNGGTFTVDQGDAATTSTPANWPYLMASINTQLNVIGGVMENVLSNYNHAVETYEFFLDADLTQPAGTYDPNTNSIEVSNGFDSQAVLYLRVTANLDISTSQGSNCGAFSYICYTPVQYNVQDIVLDPAALPAMNTKSLLGFAGLLLSLGMVFLSRKGNELF